MRMALVWTTLALTTALSLPAAAEDVEQAQRLMNEAHALAKAGDPRGAIRKLDEAYAAAPKVSILFNKGTIYVDLLRAGRARADDLREAIACFQRYAETGSDAAKREVARARLEEIKKALAAMKQPEAPAGDPAPAEKKPSAKAKAGRSELQQPPQSDLRNPWAARPRDKASPSPSGPAAAPLIAPAAAGVEVSTSSFLGGLGLRADREAEFAKHVKRGIDMSRRGDRDGAVAEFVTAHDLIPRPDLLRDAGDESMLGCVGKNKSVDGEDDAADCYKRAADFYRRYLESTGAPPDRPEIEHKIRDANQKARNAEITAQTARAARATQKEEKRGLWLKLAISSEVLAVAATAGAIALFVVGKGKGDELLALRKDGEDIERQRNLGTVQVLHAIGGGATVLSALLSAGGGVLFWNARRTPNGLTAWIVPVGVGFALAGRF